jgi:hypothetical protein
MKTVSEKVGSEASGGSPDATGGSPVPPKQEWELKYDAAAVRETLREKANRRGVKVRTQSLLP